MLVNDEQWSLLSLTGLLINRMFLIWQANLIDEKQVMQYIRFLKVHQIVEAGKRIFSAVRSKSTICIVKLVSSRKFGGVFSMGKKLHRAALQV